MKKVLVAIVAVMGLSVTSFANDQVEIKDVQIGFNDAFIPSGFDSNSDAFIVASGIFPNGCYRWKDAEVKHEGAVHEIRGTAAVSQGMCLMVLVPFTKEIRLGKLNVGQHQVRLMNGDGTYIEKKLNIEE